MILRCVALISPAGQPLESSQHLTLGEDYVTLTITVGPGGGVQVRVIDNHGSSMPGVYPGEMFESVSGSIPSNWTAQMTGDGLLRLGPEAWLRPGFWEEYFDGSEFADEVYKKELAKIVESK